MDSESGGAAVNTSAKRRSLPRPSKSPRRAAPRASSSASWGARARARGYRDALVGAFAAEAFALAPGHGRDRPRRARVGGEQGPPAARRPKYRAPPPKGERLSWPARRRDRRGGCRVSGAAYSQRPASSMSLERITICTSLLERSTSLVHLGARVAFAQALARRVGLGDDGGPSALPPAAAAPTDPRR